LNLPVIYLNYNELLCVKYRLLELGNWQHHNTTQH
jgi:hypothetical protein